jgi:hypothetical protein
MLGLATVITAHLVLVHQSLLLKNIGIRLETGPDPIH